MDNRILFSGCLSIEPRQMRESFVLLYVRHSRYKQPDGDVFLNAGYAFHLSQLQ